MGVVVVADLTVGDPALVIVVVAGRDDRRVAEIAALGHFTWSRTLDSFCTFVPETGLCETTVVHLVVPAPGPVVE